ncbi:MAG: Sugar transporter ATP-binding protein [Bacilli bacterium]|nr:Sugar transporter ATP-binding protein [Bacilli bacterium]
MEELIIEISGLKKEFKVAQRREGLRSSIQSLFNRQYKMVQAVEHVDLNVTKGEIRGLIGPNGAGKSTTIKIMSGILHPSEGTVRVMGYTPWEQREAYVKHIGVVFGQKSQLWWDLPALDTFALHKQMYQIPEKRFRENVNFLTELLNIREVVTKPVRQLSLGERMKCELVSALLHDPPLIFLDEPTIGLDILSKETIRRFIKQLNQDKKTTFIITTHDMADLENLCERVTIINKGIVVYDDALGKLNKIYAGRKIVELTFFEPIQPEILKDFKVTAFNELSASIEVGLTDGDIMKEIYLIMSSLPSVHDININNISIEEVIKEIYLA